MLVNLNRPILTGLDVIKSFPELEAKHNLSIPFSSNNPMPDDGMLFNSEVPAI